jgi:hypothetical protein
MSQLVRSLALLAALGLTTACGNNPTDRAPTGGAGGAAGGAAVGSTVGHPVGAATTPRTESFGGGGY